jgi:hypothetical protein
VLPIFRTPSKFGQGGLIGEVSTMLDDPKFRNVPALDRRSHEAYQVK